MRARWITAGVLLIALGGAGAFYAFTGTPEPPPATIAGASECDSCGARKQNLKRVQQALSPAPAPGAE